MSTGKNVTPTLVRLTDNGEALVNTSVNSVATLFLNMVNVADSPIAIDPVKLTLIEYKHNASMNEKLYGVAVDMLAIGIAPGGKKYVVLPAGLPRIPKKVRPGAISTSKLSGATCLIKSVEPMSILPAVCKSSAVVPSSELVFMPRNARAFVVSQATQSAPAPATPTAQSRNTKRLGPFTMTPRIGRTPVPLTDIDVLRIACETVEPSADAPDD